MAQTQERAAPTILSAESLANLPRDLIDNVRRAIFSGSKKRLDKLISEVAEHGHGALAGGIQGLADRYEYDELNRLLEEKCLL